jgi:signal transduction histidine kinase
MITKLKILMLEDVESDVGLVNHMLKKNGLQFDIKRVDTKDEFSTALRDYHPDVILSDHSLPQFNSIEALKIYKQSALNVPFILVTGSVSEEFAVTCLKQGADDYILKTNLLRLPRAIENALHQRTQAQAQKKSEEEKQLHYEATVKLNRELDNFVYSISHNIRSPLTSVMGLLTLAKREDDNRDRFFKDYFDMLERSVQKLDETLREITEYSRNARTDLSNENVDMRAIVAKCHDRLKYLPGWERVTTHVTLAQQHEFFTDPYRLEIILFNLINNSIKYRDERKQNCTLDIHATIENNVATITLADNGIGIDSLHLPRVFDMFFRASVQSDGAGLGLYIVKEATLRLGGQVQIDSHLGEGTVCKIVVPAGKITDSIHEEAAA